MSKEIVIFLGIGTLILVGFLILGGFASLEPQLINAATATDTTSVTLTVTEEISLTPPSNITMSPNITMTQDSSTGGGAWNVKTNSQAGYTLSLHADDTDCLDAAATGEYFTDCATTTPGVWATVCENANAYVFGFSAYGNDVPDGTWGSGSDCTTGFPTNNLNYRGFASTTDIQIASASSETGQTGTDSTMCVAAEQGDNVYAPDGSYSTTITGTATTQ